MAALVHGQYPLQWQDGQAERAALYALRNVTTGDTFDVAEQFTNVKRAFVMGATVAGQAAVVTITGTVITLPTGLTNDAGWALVFGCAS